MTNIVTFQSDKPCRKCGGLERYKRDARCKPCQRAREALYHATARGQAVHRASKKRYALTANGQAVNRTLSFRRQCKKYNTTLEAVEQLRVDQYNVCQICGAPDPTELDHCHTTNNVRAWLCHPCNSGIGHFKDSPAALRRAADYFEAGGSTWLRENRTHAIRGSGYFKDDPKRLRRAADYVEFFQQLHQRAA